MNDALSKLSSSAATGDFSPQHKLDEGSFGAVYRGKLADGRGVAIKVLTRLDDEVPEGGSEQYTGAGSFALEAKVLGKYRHPNLVGLHGHCLEEAMPTRYLVYEFMSGGSLYDRLGPPTAATGDAAAAAAAAAATAWPPLLWASRFTIASDVARALEFLHNEANPPIIHQDVKSDNILLCQHGGQILAKLADFGAVRIAPVLLTDKTHMSTREIVGTRPYQPNEYISMGHVSEKTDTFAFGVVLLELLTGKPAVNEETNEFLYSEMQEVLQQVVAPQPLSVSVSFISSSSPVMRLLPLLDAAAGGDVKRDRQLRKRVTTLALITAKCVEMFARKRCTVSEVLPELDALAGREAARRWCARGAARRTTP